MRFAIRLLLTSTIMGLFLGACSSDEPTSDPTDGGTGGKGSGGKGSGGKGSGAAGSAATGGAASMCAADAGGDGCRKCLAAYCCSDYMDCVASPSCTKALDKHAACIAETGAETAACFGDLTRELQGDAAGLTAIPLCILNSCSASCAGPGPV
jgi:hypothetical protein